MKFLISLWLPRGGENDARGYVAVRVSNFVVMLEFWIIPGIQSADNHIFKDIAQLLAQFSENLDLVPSDIAAGLLLIYQQQTAKRATMSGKPENEDVADSETVDDAGMWYYISWLVNALTDN